MQALITDHLTPKRWGGVYSDHLEYDLPQEEVDESDPIMLQQYLANMTAKTVKYARDQLFHEIPRVNNPTTVHVMHFNHHKVESTQVLNGLPFILDEYLLINHNNFITKSGIEQATMDIWDKEKRTVTNPNEIHNEEMTEVMFKGTGLMPLDLDQDP